MTDDPIFATGGVVPVGPPAVHDPLTVRSVGPAADPVKLARRCVAHRYHQPVPRYLEEHHVVPRAWQAAWRPPDTPGTIWHPETVLVCRDGHGNIHYWIEQFMLHVRLDDTPEEAARRVLNRAQNVGRQEHVIARRALERWVSNGGSLTFLAERGLNGGIYGGNTNVTPS